ncbi:hypothetical protein LINGRAHAP2_LOCUS4514, partial [Linum grandiflorum]
SNNRSLFLSPLEFYASDIEYVKSVVLNNAPKNQMTFSNIQKDIVHALAVETSKLITIDIGDDFFVILAYESQDVSIKKQMGVVPWYVNGEGCVIERFLGISQVSDTKAVSLKMTIKSMLVTPVPLSTFKPIPVEPMVQPTPIKPTLTTNTTIVIKYFLNPVYKIGDTTPFKCNTNIV